MKNLLNSKTMNNLVRAYAGESQASNRYRQLSEACYDKGLNQLGKFIKMISTNEYYHAKQIYSFIQSASDKPIDGLVVDSNYPFKEDPTKDFLEAFKLAASNENEEATEVYPSFSRIAKEEGFEDIARFFNNLVQVETCHKLALTEFYNQLKNDTMYNRTPAIKWKCARCGYESTQEHGWEKCPICGASKGDIELNLPQ